MERPARTDYQIHELIARRWSPRAFSPRPVEAEKLRSLLEAARWAASSNNEQPWSYLVATKEEPEAFAKMSACLVPGNQTWATQAPVLMVSVVKTFFDRGNKPNRVALHDVGAASAQLTMEAMHLGLFVHQMGGIEVEKIRTDYALPAGYDPVAGLAVGYPGDLETLPEALKAREVAERVRKPIKEWVFGTAWGTPAGIVKG